MLPDEGNGGFGAALFDAERPVPEGVIGAEGETSVKRFNVYRNNVVVSLIESLGDTYPAIRTLLGEEYFSALARAYMDVEPPTSPILMKYGAGFAGFIEAFPPLASYPYLESVARLEWAWLTAYHAKDDPVMAGEALAQIPEADVGNVVFVPHAAAHLVNTRWPVLSLTFANRFDPDGGHEIDLKEAQPVLVTRPAYEVEMRLMRPGGDVFTAALLRGATLQEAAEQAAAASAEFAFADCLSDVLSCGTFSHLDVRV